MKLGFLLLLPLLVGARPSAPPVVRVTFSPLTKTAYLQAKKYCIETKPRVTFPLKKVGGRIVILTAKGQRIFRDGWIEGEHDEDTRYKYLGYWPSLHWHLVEGYHYSEVYRLNALTQSGQWLKLEGFPELAPDTSQFVVASGALDGVGAPTIQLFQLKKGVWQERWRIEPKAWQVEQLKWVASNTLLLQERHWNKDFSKSWYTYAQLTIH
jgi:hypothetical protein